MKSVPMTSGEVNEDPFECAQLSSCSCHDLEIMGLDQALREFSKTSLAPESGQLLLHDCLSFQNSKRTLQANCKFPFVTTKFCKIFKRPEHQYGLVHLTIGFPQFICRSPSLLFWHEWQKKSYSFALSISHKSRL